MKRHSELALNTAEDHTALVLKRIKKTSSFNISVFTSKYLEMVLFSALVKTQNPTRMDQMFSFEEVRQSGKKKKLLLPINKIFMYVQYIQQHDKTK